jgi:hypothetical protein
MSMQSFSGPPARNQFKAASKPSKVSLGAGHASTVKASTAGAQGNGHTPGSGVKGFSGTSVKSGKIKV